MEAGSIVIFEDGANGVNSRALARFIDLASQAAGLKGSVSVLVANNSTIRQLNRRYRRKNSATDVLSFPASRLADGLGGDIAISRKIAAANAHARGHSLADEIRILILHGILHLAGYDHEADRGEMRQKERELRRKLRLPSSLIERSLTPRPSALGLEARKSGLRRRGRDPRRQRT
jgi:probable rRNA maturation factor